MSSMIAENLPEVFGSENVVLVSHHPISRSSSPSATVYQVWVREDSPCQLRDAFYLKGSEDFDRIDNLPSDTTFLFNSLQSLLEDRSAELLSRVISNGFNVAVYWHETAWNIRTLGSRSGELLHQAISLLTIADAVHLVPTRQSIHPVVMLTGCAFERIFPIYEVADLVKFKLNIDRPSSPRIVLGSGALDARKGFDLFRSIALIFSQEKALDVEFHWYSTTFDDSRVLAESRSAPSNLRLFSRSNEFEKVVKQSSVFLMSSRDDPSPLVALEALAVGTPVLCFASTGIAEIVPSNFICRDVGEIPGRLRQLLNQTPDPIAVRKLAEPYDSANFLSRLQSINESIQIAKDPVPTPGKWNITPVSYGLDSLIRRSNSGLRALEIVRQKEHQIQMVSTLARANSLKQLRSRWRGLQIGGNIAVVGNGPKLLTTQIGDEINSHDCVIRLNNFSTSGFEKNVGSRTDLVILSPASQSSPDLLKYLEKRKAIVFSGRTDWNESAISKRLQVTFSEFVDPAKFDLRWTQSWNLLLHLLYPVSPQWHSTGFATIALLFHLTSGSDSINLYGFDFLTESPTSLTTSVDHYHGATTKIDHAHRFDLEKNYVQGMQRVRNR